MLYPVKDKNSSFQCSISSSLVHKIKIRSFNREETALTNKVIICDFPLPGGKFITAPGFLYKICFH